MKFLLFLCFIHENGCSQMYVLPKNDVSNNVWLWREGCFSLVSQDLSKRDTKRNMIRFLSWTSDCNSIRSIWKFARNVLKMESQDMDFFSTVLKPILQLVSKQKVWLLFFLLLTGLHSASVPKCTLLSVTLVGTALHPQPRFLFQPRQCWLHTTVWLLWEMGPHGRAELLPWQHWAGAGPQVGHTCNNLYWHLLAKATCLIFFHYSFNCDEWCS